MRLRQGSADPQDAWVIPRTQALPQPKDAKERASAPANPILSSARSWPIPLSGRQRERRQRRANARKHHQPCLWLRHLPRRLSGRLGRGVARTRHQGAAGRLADCLRHIHHSWRRDYHRRSSLLRDARHVLAPRLVRR